MFSKIVSKVLVDKGVLGGRRKEVFLFVLTVLELVGGDVGENIKTDDWGRGYGSTGDDIGGTVGDVEEGIVFQIVKDRPGELGGWGTGDERSGCWGTVSVKVGTWEIPSIVVRLENFEDGGSSIGSVLLIYIIKGQPRSDGDVGEGRGDNGGGL